MSLRSETPLPMRGFRGKGLLNKFISIFGLVASIGKTIIFLFQNKINFVVCFGGYISLPVGIAAILCRKQLILHEQNAVMGTSNKLLAPFAKIVFLGTPLATVSQKNTQLVGNPIKRINKHQDMARKVLRRCDIVPYSVEEMKCRAKECCKDRV